MSEAKQDPDLAWGAAEYAARITDLAAVKAGVMTVADFQARAMNRQRNAGLSFSQASKAVKAHVLALRWQEFERRTETQEAIP